VLLWLVLVAAAEDRAELENLKVTASAEQIAVSAVLVNGFDEELLERLASGLPTELTYRFSLYRDRKRWWDSELAKSTYQVIAMYNAVSREYLVNYKLDGKLTETRVVRNLDELERAMTVLEQVPIFSMATMKPKIQTAVQRTRVLVRGLAELGGGTWLFVFPTTRTTDGVRSRKFRLDGGL
jgi:hypothetical protein